MSTVDHVLLTRFNLPSVGNEGRVRAQEGWLQSRIELFERYTVPSVRAQTAPATGWLIYLDPQSPRWLIDRMEPLAAEGLCQLVYRETVGPAEIRQDIADRLSTHGDVLITTNLDNDDGLAQDFLQRIRTVPTTAPRTAIYLARGLIRRGDALYRHRDATSAFCSVRESSQDPVTCWVDWHNLLPTHMPSIAVEGDPAWLQIVHGGNVSNRIRGALVSPAEHAAAFGGLLADVPTPSTARRLRDTLLDRPRRTLREGGRRLGKQVILRLGGKGGLDRAKAVLGSLRPTRTKVGSDA